MAEQTTGIRLLSGTTQVQLLPGANCRSGGYAACALRFSVSALPREAFLSTHRVCGPPVKRCELGAMPRGGAIFSEHVRPVEEAVLKTVAPCKVSGVQVPGAPLFSRPCSSTDSERSSPKGSDASATLAKDTDARMVQKQHG